MGLRSSDSCRRVVNVISSIQEWQTFFSKEVLCKERSVFSFLKDVPFKYSARTSQQFIKALSNKFSSFATWFNSAEQRKLSNTVSCRVVSSKAREDWFIKNGFTKWRSSFPEDVASKRYPVYWYLNRRLKLSSNKSHYVIQRLLSIDSEFASFYDPESDLNLINFLTKGSVEYRASLRKALDDPMVIAKRKTRFYEVISSEEYKINHSLGQARAKRLIRDASLIRSYGHTDIKRIIEDRVAKVGYSLVSFDLINFKLSDGDLVLFCNKCKKEFRSKFNHGHVQTCPSCHYNATKLELYLLDFIQSFGLEVKPHYLIQGSSHLDIFVSYKGGIAFEINGAYSHNSAPLSKLNPYGFKEVLYHANKTTLALSKGIKLYHLWEHVSRPKLESVIRAKLGRPSKVVYARSLRYELLLGNDSRVADLLSSSHILGAVKVSFSGCLFEGSSIIQVVSFVVSGSKCELIRNCTELGSSVIGGFSRLLVKALQYIHQHYPHIHQIITYADRDLSPDPYNTVYSRNGFTCLNPHNPQPTLSYYVHHSVRDIEGSLIHRPGVYSRFRFQKHKLSSLFSRAGVAFSPELTEKENLLKLNIWPIYNSGCFKYVLDI